MAVIRRILPHPPVVPQTTRATCWAAALASLIRVTNSKGRWYGGAGGSTFGRVTPPTDLDIVDFVRKFDAGPEGMITQGTWALSGNSWKYVAENIFGLRPTKYLGVGAGALGKFSFINDIKENIGHHRYVILFFADPDWGTDEKGNVQWHGKIVYGYEEDRSKGTFFVHGMDPDPDRPSYYPDVIVDDQSYVSNSL